MPALAAVAALLQAVVAMLNANAYRSTEGIGLLTGMAALGLFLALVGSRVMLSAVQGGYALAAEGGEPGRLPHPRYRPDPRPRPGSGAEGPVGAAEPPGADCQR